MSRIAQTICRYTAGTLGVPGAFAKGAPIRIISAQATGDDAYYARADSGL
jgi:hypothetical protein